MTITTFQFIFLLDLGHNKLFLVDFQCFASLTLSKVDMSGEVLGTM